MYNQCLNPGCVVYIALFAIVSIIHLVKCFKEKQKWADITKFMLMPILLLFFLAFTLVSAQTFSLLHILIISALVFSFLGDAALLFDGEKRNFALGMLFFAITQICYIIFAVIDVIGFEIPIIQGAILAIIFLAFMIYSFLRIKKQLKGLKTIVIIYSFIISTMSWLFIIAAFENPSVDTILTAVGSILFIISDMMVAYQYFMGRLLKGRFFIMLTYILAQLLIVLGAIGIIGA